MANWHLSAELVLWIARVDAPLHARLAGRLLPLFTGILFAQRRRTVASWLRAADRGDSFRAYYYFLGSPGRKVKYVAVVLLRQAVRRITVGDRLLFGRFADQTLWTGGGSGRHPLPAEQK